MLPPGPSTPANRTRIGAALLSEIVTAVTRLVRDGSWIRLARGVYLVAPVPPAWPALAWAGCLIGGNGARLGGLAAGHLARHRGGTGPDRGAHPDAVRVPRLDGPWWFHRERSGARDPRTVGSPPRLPTPRRILQAAEQRRCLPRRSLVVRTLADVAAGVRSPLERDYLHLVERAHGLPDGQRQISRRWTEVDVLYAAFRLLVELDGRLGHEGMGRFRDMRRDNASTSDGLATLRYGKADVFGSPCEVAAEVSRNLMLRGWEGPSHPCIRCREVA